MLYFLSDYTEGAHPQVLRHLMDVNMVSLPGYGDDPQTEAAKAKICAACGREDLQIWFLTGGTQTNQIAIDSMLRSFEGVIAADTGHINCHEAGAIEYSGHRVLPIPHVEGKLMAADLDRYMTDFLNDEVREHLVQPGMVYISHPTEYGTLYSKAELENLSQVCRRYALPLFLDGARLGYGLMSRETDLRLEDIARLCDVFYIGGTKVGALCGEALVFTHKNAPEHFPTLIKQRGAMLAKGRLLGVQFDALFTDGLYFAIGSHAIEKAERLKEMFRQRGYAFYLDSPTNQQFIVLRNEKAEELRQHVRFTVWEKPDDKHTVARFCTSWATTDEELDELEKLI